VTETTRGDRTRAAVLEVAARHVASHGLDGMRGARVAAEADVSEATVWFHFGTKTGLLAAVMDAYYDRLVTDLTAVIDAQITPSARLDAFAHAWFARIAQDLPLVAELGRQGRHGHDPGLIARFADCNRGVTRLFERLVEDLIAGGTLRDDLAPRVMRDAFFGTAEHVLIGRAITGRPADLGGAARSVLDLLFYGAATGGRDATTPVNPSLASLDAKLDALLARPFDG
jgi:TetR/AcrR family fatty acid metabolism transcriptional regulator